MTHTAPIRCYTLPRAVPARGRVFVLPLRASAGRVASPRGAGLSLTWSLDRAAGRLVSRWASAATQPDGQPVRPERLPTVGDVTTRPTAVLPGPASSLAA
jgi:hypothetical protein